MQSLVLPRWLLDQILEHARSAPDVEVCGLVAAKDGVPVRCTAVRNIAEQPQRFFAMDPRQQIEAFRVMRERGEQLFGIYHSHPRGEAYPSDTDLQQLGYPEALQIIVSPHTTATAQVRCYRLVDGTVQELELAH